MARSFAVVAEGKTDPPVIENILAGYFSEDPEEVDVRYALPAHDEPVGWRRLLRFLREGEYGDAFQFVDYVVVQIDTDCSGQPGYDVPHDHPPFGPPRTPDELVAAVRARLETLIGPAGLADHPGQFLFAVCVHDIECWLLPLHSPGHAGELRDGARLVSHGLHLADRPRLSKSEVPTYETASREYRDRPTLLVKGGQQPSLRLFLNSLGALPAIPPGEHVDAGDPPAPAGADPA